MNRLKELRKKEGLTLRELGEQVNMFSSRLSQYETGKREPKLETWQKLANFFQVPVPYLQGLGMSRDQAIDLCWDWAHNQGSYGRWAMNRIFKKYFTSHYDKKTLHKIFSSKENFAAYMVKHWGSIFDYDSLSRFNDTEDLENEIAMVMGDHEQTALASIYDIDFKNDSNEEIQSKLDGIITEIFMYIDGAE